MKVINNTTQSIQSNFHKNTTTFNNNVLLTPDRDKTKNCLFGSQNLSNKNNIKIPSFLLNKTKTIKSHFGNNPQYQKYLSFKVSSDDSQETYKKTRSNQQGTASKINIKNKNVPNTPNLPVSHRFSVKIDNYDRTNRKKSWQELHSILKQQQRFYTKSQNRCPQTSQKKIVKVPNFLNKFSQKKKELPFKFDNSQKQYNKTEHSYALQQKQNNSQNTYQFGLKINIKGVHKSKCLNDFHLVKLLGSGSFGKAYLAVDKLTDFVCVIKMLKKSQMSDYQKMSLIRQIKIQSYLSHRHLTSLYGIFYDQQYIYLIMQPLPYGNLKTKYKKQKLNQKQASRIVHQICLGVNQMHQSNIIHRDIKCQNIFLFQNYAKLGDFGCSVYSDEKRKSFVGSPLYLSPQQLRNECYDEKVDLWQIGVLTYQLIFQKPPFENDIKQMVCGIKSTSQLSQLYFPFQISDDGRDFIEKLLDKDYTTRMSLKQALNHNFIQKTYKQDIARLYS